jgi:hypothetical protein
MYSLENSSIILFVSIVCALAGMVWLPIDIVVKDNVSEEELVEE